MNFENVQLAHGGGGSLSKQLTEEIFLPAFRNATLACLNDSAIVNFSGNKLAFTTDSFVIDPVFFPGGDIGHLAVCGTVNDLAMMGAEPKFLSCGFILEEGLPFIDLKRIVNSMKSAADEAGVEIVTGDTKVVPKSKCDKIFINTAGIGVYEKLPIVAKGRAKPDDVIIVNNPVGSHGMAVMTSRSELGFNTVVKSDAAPLNGLVREMLQVSDTINVMRDATRGGLATVLNEIASQSKVIIEIDENAVPINADVRGSCELLGFDPLYVANEGVIVAAMPAAVAAPVLAKMRKHKYGRQAVMIGQVKQSDRPGVILRTTLGSQRILGMLSGEQLPRIC